VEIGKRGIWEQERVAELWNDVSYFVFDLAEASPREPVLIQSMLRELMEGFAGGDPDAPPTTSLSHAGGSQCLPVYGAGETHGEDSCYLSEREL